MGHVLAFDLDGTLVVHAGDLKFDDVNSLREGCIPDRQAQDRVRGLIAAGHEVHVVTGRGRIVRDVTFAQVEAIHPHIWVHHQDRFSDLNAMRQWKASRLRGIGAAAYVGDHIMDELAAEDAGIPFMHIDEFRAGAQLLDLPGGQDLAVQQVVPGNGVASAVRRPEERRLLKGASPRAAARKVQPRAVAGVVHQDKAVVKVRHGRRKPVQSKKPAAPATSPG